MLAWTGQIPVWLVSVILGRDLVIVCGALSYHFFISHYDISPSWFGKACTMSQILYVLVVIVTLAEMPMPQSVVDYGLWAVAGITIFSGLHYACVWTWRGWHVLKTK